MLSIVALHSRGAFGEGAWWVPYWNNLAWGVAVFFVISGFLLYRPFVAARAGQAPPIGVRDFYRRRALRILPGYWVALTVLAVVFGIPEVFGRHWWQFYGLLQAYDSSTFRGGLIVTWSLSIEAGLYLLLPLFATVSLRAGAGRWEPWRSALGATVLVTLATLLVAQDAFGHVSTTATAVLDGATWFGFGMVLASLSVAAGSSATAAARPFSLARRFPEACWLLALALFVAAGYAVDRLGRRYDLLEGVAAVLIVLPAIALTGAAGLRRNLVELILVRRAVAWLGLISYGLFLWHDVLLLQLRGMGEHDATLSAVAPTLAAWVLTLACAAASFYLVELPAMKAGRKQKRTGGRARTR